jgi:hypothetical protein
MFVGCSTNVQSKPDFSGTWVMTTEPLWMRPGAGEDRDHQFETIIKQSAIIISTSQRVILSDRKGRSESPSATGRIRDRSRRKEPPEIAFERDPATSSPSLKACGHRPAPRPWDGVRCGAGRARRRAWTFAGFLAGFIEQTSGSMRCR